MVLKFDSDIEKWGLKDIPQGLSVILRVLSCWRSKIDVDKFEKYMKGIHTKIHEIFDWMDNNETLYDTMRWNQINHKKKVHPKFLQNLFFHIPIDMFAGEKKILP